MTGRAHSLPAGSLPRQAFCLPGRPPSPQPRAGRMHPQPVALVTGGSRGIGRGVCAALAAAGYAVAINFAANLAAAEETQRLCGGDTLLCQADVGRRADRERLVEEVLAR